MRDTEKEIENYKKEIEYYKKEVIQLEDYLVDCINIFIESGVSGESETIPKITLRDWIKWSIVSIKTLTNKPPIIERVSKNNDGEFLRGVRFAYLDCIHIMQDIADDTEGNLPKNKKVRHRLIHTASGYRRIGESFQTRMYIVMDMGQEDIQEMRNGGRLGRTYEA